MSSTVTTYTPVTKSGQITFTGLGNGVDFDQLITKLVQVEQGRVTTLQTWKQSWTKKQAAFQELNTAMLALQTSLESLDSIGEFLTKKVDSSDATVLTAVSDADAQEGSHTITVNRLAAAKAMVTTVGYSSQDVDINPSASNATFAYTYQGKTYANTVGANSSLSDLVAIINADASNPGVKASVAYDGSSYYLQLRGMDTGDNATLVIASNSTLIGFSGSDFSTIASNCSARLKLDGWPSGTDSWITRETNSVSDLVDGLTISFKTTGTSTLTTTTDTDAVKENIQTFVEQMNTVRTLIKEITDYDSTTKSGSILTGNYGIQLIDSRLKSMTASKGVGFDYSTDAFSALSQVGILTDADEGSTSEGLLVIDEKKLDACLASNADGVAQLFSASYAPATSTNDFSISSYIKGTTKCGTYDVAYTCDASGKITSATINGHQAMFSSNSNLITGSYGYDEAGIVLKAIDVSAGEHTGTASLKQGKTGELGDLLDELNDTTDGPLAILDNNYDDITSMIDEKIAFEQNRLANYASRLKKRFAKVDALLGTYSNMQTQLKSAIDQLSSS